MHIHFRQVMMGVIAGVIAGILSVSILLSFAALIFAGPLEDFIANGIALALVGSGIMNFVYALFSTRPPIVVLAQDGPALIVALLASNVAATLGYATVGEATYATIVAAIGVSTLATGVAFVSLGQFRLGSLVRFFPYPVIGGFLAGTGWLLVLGGIGVSTGGPSDLASLPGLLRSASVQMLAGVSFGIVTLITLRRVQHILMLPGLLLAGTLLFYLWLGVAGISLSEAQARGWLLGPFSERAVWRPLTPSLLVQVQWSAIAAEGGSIGTAIALSVIGLLLNVSGLQLARREDIDLNQELRAAGFAQFAAGLAGSTPGFPSLGISTLSHRIGARTPLVGVVAGSICLAAFIFGADLLALMPRMVLGGVVCYLGFAFLADWLYDSWFKLPRGDYVLIVSILTLVIVLGILPAVVVGLVIAVMLFVVAYSQTDVVRHTLSGATVNSRMTRGYGEQQWLREHGEQIAIFQLQGFLFFGTAHALYERIRTRTLDEQLPALHFVLLDFRLVSHIDSTAMLSFTKILQLAESKGFILLFVDLTPTLQRQIERSVFHGEQQATMRVLPDLDRGLEWCEDELLATMREKIDDREQPTLLFQNFDTLLRYFEKRTIEPGHYLIRQGDQPDDMFFIERGQVTAQIESSDGLVQRLETMRGGRVVGELGFFLGRPRTAAVVADQTSLVYRITQLALHRLERAHPEVAAEFHQVMARLLSERVIHLIDTVEALQR